MGKEKVVLDTNILISALGWTGKPRKIFDMCVDGQSELIISQKQIDELAKVLDYPKFNFTQEQKDTFLAIILKLATLVEIEREINAINEDPADNAILEAAVAGNADYIISGDPHLLKLRQFEKIRILSAAEFLENF